MVDNIAIKELVDSIKQPESGTSQTYGAVVSRVDKEGVVWIYLAGTDKETPTASTSSEVKSGDVVNVEWRNNKLYIAGNYSNPSAGVTRVQAVEAAANTAREAANNAVADAGRARQAADEATATAESVRGIAEQAMEDASEAQTAASNAETSASQAASSASTAGISASNAQAAAEAAETAANLTITTDTIHYLATSAGSGVTRETAGWSTTVQNVTAENRYLWTYHTYTKRNSTSVDTDPVITGVYGQAGASGEDGATIWTTTTAPATPNYTFTISNLSGPSGMEPKIGDVIIYSYYRYQITSMTTTTVRSTGRVSIRGATGASSKWYSGTGITGTSTTATIFSGSGVSSAVVGDMYLNTDTNNTYRCTTAGAPTAAKWVYVDNIQGEQGPQGETGPDGTSITVTNIRYAVSQTETQPADSAFTYTSVPTVAEGEWLWTRTLYSDNSKVYTKAKQGEQGPQGQTGADGDDGIGITEVVPQYGLSASTSTAPSTWSYTMVYNPATPYVWTREEITYSDSTAQNPHIGYSDAVYNQALTDTFSTVMQVKDYFWHDANGAHVLGSTSGYRTDIVGTGMKVMDAANEVSVAEFGVDGARIGDADKCNAELKNQSFIIHDLGDNSFFEAIDLRGNDGYYEVTENKTANGVSDSFQSIVDNVTEGSEKVYVNNVLLTSGYTTAYSADKHFQITGFNPSLTRGDIITVKYQTTSNSLKYYTIGTRISTKGFMSVALGERVEATGYASIAEGAGSKAYGAYSHAEGWATTASGSYSHAEGMSTNADGTWSHAEGIYCEANGVNSHAQNNYTIAGYKDQTTIGKFNDNQSDTAFEIGNGTSDNARSNALEVDWSGNMEASGDITDGTGNVLSAKIDASAIADYVVDQGTSGIWTYRKWNSGIAECWGTYTASIAVNTAAVAYGGYRSAQITAPNYPFEFASAPTVTAISANGGGHWVNNVASGTQNVKFYLSIGQSASAANRSIAFHVMGKWK